MQFAEGPFQGNVMQFSQRKLISGNKLQACTLDDPKIITCKGFILWNHNRNHTFKVSK